MELTAEKLREVLKYDPHTGVFTWRVSRCPQKKVGDVAGTRMNTGYLCIRVFRKLYLAHRLAWLYVHGSWPKRLIDHVNGKRDDNRMDNLREANDLQNCGNMRSSPSSGVKGVIYDKTNRYWVAYIHKQRKYKFIGAFTSKEEAAKARKQAADHYFGEFNGG